MQKRDFSLSVVIPCRNEARRLPGSIDILVEYLNQGPLPVDFEILFSIEKSKDGTANLARERVGTDKRFSILEHSEARGKGFNVRQGILAARGDCILFMDADLSVPLRFVMEFYEHFVKNPDLDVLIASRRHPASQIPNPQPFIRRWGGKAMSIVIQTCSGLSWTDTQCGFKAFRREAARQIFTRTKIDGFSFDLEVLALAAAMGLNVDEYPVEWNDVLGSSVRPFQHGIAMIQDAIRVRTLVRDTLRQCP